MSLLGSVKQRFKSVFLFFGESYGELKKVKWPTRKEMVSYTLVVLFVCTLMTFYFYGLDLGISAILRSIFQ